MSWRRNRNRGRHSPSAPGAHYEPVEVRIGTSDDYGMLLRAPRASWPLVLMMLPGCGGAHQALPPEETFSWCRQPISFSPPPSRWYRQGDNGGGMLGVRFILTGGGGQCISLGAYTSLADRDRRAALARLAGRKDSLEQREFLREVSLARARTDDPLSDREAAVSLAINQALDRAVSDQLAEQPGFAATDLEDAFRAASSYEMTLPEVLPRLRLHPESMQEPRRWRLGYDRDTVIAGLPVFASDDTLITPERALLYHEVFWVVRGCAFKATYQGTAANLPTFHRVLDSVRFPQPPRAKPR